MKLSKTQLLEKLASNPALAARNDHLTGKTSGSKLEHRHAPPPVQTSSVGKANPSRRVVCIASRRLRLLDTDNLCVKFHLDALRYLRVIENDSPDHVILEVRQEKVKNKAEECTLIEIY